MTMDSLLAMDHKRKSPNIEDYALSQADKIKQSIVIQLVNNQLMESGQKLGPMFSILVNELVKGILDYRQKVSAHIDIIIEVPYSRKKAPWPDYKGNDLFEGDVIKHPSGEQGVIIYYEMREGEYEHDKWRVRYEDCLSRLGLQIGDKGQAVKVEGL